MYYLAEGGSSLDAPRLVHQLLKRVTGDFEKNLADELLDTLFNKTFAEVKDFLSTAHHIISKSCTNSTYLTKRNEAVRIHKDKGYCDAFVYARFIIVSPAQDQILHELSKLAKVWCLNLEKCIDSSPTVYVISPRAAIIYIGSHSGLFVAIDFITGSLIWKYVLPDRIESSACLVTTRSKGVLVLIGCYDHHLYAFDAFNGKLLSSFKSTGPIKCTPIFDSTTRNVWFGCHGNTLYCLDYSEDNPMVVFKMEFGASIFSSCSLSATHVVACAISGEMVSICKETFKLSWDRGFYPSLTKKPIFSTPLIFSTSIIVASVDGFVYCYSVGSDIPVMKWKYDTGGPCFSSPVYMCDVGIGLVCIGSHSGFVHFIRVVTGEFYAKIKYDSAIFATPCCTLNQMTCVSTSGQLKSVQFGDNAEFVCRNYQIKGQCFSSGLMIGKWFLQANRNDTIELIDSDDWKIGL